MYGDWPTPFQLTNDNSTIFVMRGQLTIVINRNQLYLQKINQNAVF